MVKARVICFYNHKGGVGKTTMVAAIAGELVAKGKKVILIDTDSQSNLTTQFYPTENPEVELADYLFEPQIGIRKIINLTKYPGLFIIPSRKLSIGGKMDKWTRSEATEIENRNAVKNLITEIKNTITDVDYIVFDMPPSYSELEKKVLLACDEVIPVLQIDKYSIDGLSDFFILLNKLKCGDEKPVLKRLIFNNYDKRKLVQKSIIPAIENLTLKNYLVPNDEAFRKAAMQSKAVQAIGGLKPETTEIIELITKNIMEEE